MANVTITQLPEAGPITGLESIPIVQNGQTVRTTTGAIAASPSQVYQYLTTIQTPELPNSRYVGATNGLVITDGGAQGLFNISTTGALNSLVNSGTGIQAKTTGTTVEARAIVIDSPSQSGLSIADGNGVGGNPSISLVGSVLSLANLSANGLLKINTSGALSATSILEVADQTSVTNGDAVAGSPTIGLATNPTLPGSGAVLIPTGNTSDRPTGANGKIRYNLTNFAYEGYSNGSWQQFAVSGGVTQINTGTGLTGGPITSAGTISIADTGVTAGIYGSATQVGQFNVNAQGQIISASDITITAAGIGAVESVAGTPNEITATGTSNVTLSLPSALTFTGKTITDGDYVTPVIKNNFKFESSGIGAYSQFAGTIGSWISNTNNFQVVYAQNQNNGSDASADWVAYNDASDGASYFIDMGINSSNYTSATYPIFSPNSAYVFTGGGGTGQQTDLYIGTSNAASDIIFFTGDVQVANVRGSIQGDTGNWLVGTTTDTGEKLQVVGTAKISGAASFGSTVLLNENPTLALQAATKQYVDSQVTAGLHIHEPVRVETTANLIATYTQGGTTFDITDITGNKTLTTSVNHGLVLNDQIWLYTTAGNGLSTNTAYFVYSTPALNQITVSLTFNGAEVTGLTNATGLTYNTRANSGVGAKLTNAGAQVALSIDTIPLALTNRVMVRLQTNAAENGVYTVTDVGSGATNWELTRATDSDQVNPADPNGVGTGDYYFTQEGLLNAGDSHVLTTEPNTMILGYTGLTYTQFSGGITYTGGTNIDVTGQVISLTGTVAATNGGTGAATVAVGDILYGSAIDTWSKFPLGPAYKSLIVNASGTQLEWNAVALNQAAAVSGQLGVSNGGTGASTLSGYVFGNGASAMTASATIPNTDISGLGTMSTQNANAVAVTGGTIDGTTIGATTATTGKFTTVTATGGISGGTF